MTPARPFFRTLPVIAAVAVLGLATWAFSQLQAPETKPAPGQTQVPAATEPKEERRPAQRSGESQTVPGSNAADSTQPATEVSEETGPASQTAPQATAATEAVVENPPAPAAAPVPAPDMTAFVEALRAAERANDNLAARLAQMEASAALQRERDQAFIRDMIKGVLILAGTMASVGMLALVAIVYLQLRSTKQQAITFAAQLQALTSHIALPPPSGTPAISNHGGSGHFASTAQKIEERLSDLESMTSGLPEPRSHAQAVEVPAHEPRRAAVAFSASRVASTGGTARGERSADLIAKADSLLMQQQPEVALAYIDQAISSSPRNPEAHLKRGNALERLDRLGEALTAYDRAIEAEPTLAVAFLAKAGVLNKLQRYGEALKCYEAALSQQGGGQTASESPAA
jgi:tetratricopeptide (TPR) repeat protein